MILRNGYFETYCEVCDSKYTDKYNKWCKPCQISSLNQITSKNTSKNGKIDNLIKEMQLKIKTSQDIVFQWISYDQFSNIEIINENDFIKTCSAIWKDGPLNYDKNENKYIRNQSLKVNLICFFNSQNAIDKILNEVIWFSI